ncbi:MAG: hypothetical protein IPP77_03380 [Bacteroidetes bacterium]|nr:hypothetical protein [Bacteroidota bacterium]
MTFYYPRINPQAGAVLTVDYRIDEFGLMDLSISLFLERGKINYTQEKIILMIGEIYSRLGIIFFMIEKIKTIQEKIFFMIQEIFSTLRNIYLMPEKI